MFDTQNNAFRKLFEEGKKYINLQIDYAKLTATEKISVILGMSVLFAVILALCWSRHISFLCTGLSFRASCRNRRKLCDRRCCVPVTHSDCYPIQEKTHIGSYHSFYLQSVTG